MSKTRQAKQSRKSVLHGIYQDGYTKAKSTGGKPFFDMMMYDCYAWRSGWLAGGGNRFWPDIQAVRREGEGL